MPTKSTAKPERIFDADWVEALRIARSHQQPGQTKEQTKLIAQGIAKGIAHYKSVQSAKARERDKQRKRDQRLKREATNPSSAGTARPADAAAMATVLRRPRWSLILAGTLSAALAAIGVAGLLFDRIPGWDHCPPPRVGSAAMLLVGAVLAPWYFRMAHHLRPQPKDPT